MEDKKYTLTEETDAEIFEEEAPARPRVGDIRIKKRNGAKEGDKTHLIALLSVMIFVFTIIIALLLVLCRNVNFPSGDESGGDATGEPSVAEPLNPDSPGSAAVKDYREKPLIEINKNADESATAYRPTGDAEVAIEGITSDGALLYDLTTGKIVAGKNIDEKMEIASMTKVMTLIVACDLIKSGDMYKAVKLTYDERSLSGYSTCYINKNNTPETVYVIDMLYGLILESGADCAYGLASGLAGSEAAFVQKMNEKAAALGMSNTNFNNCVGKDDYGKNYSTMRDVATMMNYAMQNALCYKILTSDKWTPVGDYAYAHLSDGTYVVKSMVHAGIKKQNIGSVSFLGGKSGNEINAGYCLVSAGKYSGKTYICVTAGHASNSYVDTAYVYKNYVK